MAKHEELSKIRNAFVHLLVSPKFEHNITAVCSSSPRKNSVGFFSINLLMPNVNYSGRTAPLTFKVAFHIFIQQL